MVSVGVVQSSSRHDRRAGGGTMTTHRLRPSLLLGNEMLKFGENLVTVRVISSWDVFGAGEEYSADGEIVRLIRIFSHLTNAFVPSHGRDMFVQRRRTM